MNPLLVEKINFYLRFLNNWHHKLFIYSQDLSKISIKKASSSICHACFIVCNPFTNSKYDDECDNYDKEFALMMDILFKLGIKRQKHNELNQTLN
jgi:hypothetical protein